jgi:hypothetical protein
MTPSTPATEIERLIATWREQAERHDDCCYMKLRDAADALEAIIPAMAEERERLEGHAAAYRAEADVAGHESVQLRLTIRRVEQALATETQARHEAETEARMGHVRLDECSDGVETKGKPLYDRISAKIQKMAEENTERGHIIAAMGAEQDELRARAESAKHRQAAAEYRAQRIVLDEELRTQLTTEREARQQAERERDRLLESVTRMAQR